jgi:hypothetical protein
LCQIGCSATAAPESKADDSKLAVATPTPTPQGESYSTTPEVEVPMPAQAVIAISFRDGLLGEICAFDLPVSFQWGEDQNLITGETEANCYLSAVQCGEACITMNSDWDLAVSLSGSVFMGADDAPQGEIHGDFVFSGTLKNYASEWPAGSIPAFTIDQPFVVEQPGIILPIVLELEDGATTQISPPSGGEPIIFTLHLGMP